VDLRAVDFDFAPTDVERIDQLVALLHAHIELVRSRLPVREVVRYHAPFRVLHPRSALLTWRGSGIKDGQSQFG